MTSEQWLRAEESAIRDMAWAAYWLVEASLSATRNSDWYSERCLARAQGELRGRVFRWRELYVDRRQEWDR